MIKHFVHVLLCIGLGCMSACGTGVGNPRDYLDSIITPLTFDDLTTSYERYNVTLEPFGVDCGSLNESSTQEELTHSRNCMENQLASCHPGKYLLDRRFQDGTRLVSFVYILVRGCVLTVNTLSTHEEIFLGEYRNKCTTLDSQEPIEFACLDQTL